MTEEMTYLIQFVNEHLRDAPETSFTKDVGREVTQKRMISFLKYHALEDDTFDNYALVQVAMEGLIATLLDEALSSLSRIWGDTSDGEAMFEYMCMNSAFDCIKLLVKFQCGYVDRAIKSELLHGKATRWINVGDLHQQLLNLLQGENQ